MYVKQEERGNDSRGLGRNKKPKENFFRPYAEKRSLGRFFCQCRLVRVDVERHTVGIVKLVLKAI
jgi:hypothetical protein